MRSINVVGGVDHAMDLDLLRISSAFPYRTWGWTGLATGAALMAAGGVLLAMHGSDVGCSMPDPQGDCPKVWSTNYWAAGLLTVGTAVATLGGVWLYLGRDESPANHSMVAGVRGRF